MAPESPIRTLFGPNYNRVTDPLNSMDAISFVLGIKSSHLRSTHLRDLIYRGRVLKTSKINDDGSAAAPAANGHANGDGDEEDSQSQPAARNDPKQAWVMAVYEDDAGDEQKWKRLITTSGASQFSINERGVTAQAYNEALEAENILMKARNFLVFQGDVEQIASQSPKDLTKLIELVSGSLEYKAEYERLQEEADQASENQNYNLHRRRGINSEIKQYQEQKKEAEAFQNKQDERDDAIVQHILWKLYHFQRVMDESAASINEHQHELEEYRRGVEKFRKQLEDARAASSEVSKRVGKVERSIKKKEKEIEDKENSLVPIDEKIGITNNQVEKLRRRLATLTKERQENKEKIENSQKQLAIVEKAKKQFEQKWEESLKQQGKQLNEADLQEYNNLRAQVVTKTSKNKSNLDNFMRQMKTDEVTFNSLKGKIEYLESTTNKLEGEINGVEERKEATKLVVKEISKEIDTKKKEFNNIQSERVRVNQRRTELDEKLQEVLKTLEDANAGARQNDKEARTREMIVSLKRIFPGVRGRIGELCKPKQKKFDEAVITALGRDFDSVVVDTEKIGSECVDYLKGQRFPPMTFIPLDNIKVTAADSSLKGLSKARLTIDTITFDSSLERAMAYACGSSIVCDDLDTAKNICFKKKIQVKAVTLEGSVIHKAGLMTGGKGPERGNKRKFEDLDIETLRRQLEQYREQIEALPNLSRRGTAEELLQNDLNGLQQRLAYAKSELASFEQNLKDLKKERDHEKRQLAEMKPKFEGKQSELESIRQTVQEFQEAVSKVEDSIFKDFCDRLGYSDVRSYEAQQGSLEQEAADKKGEFELQKRRLEQGLNWETSQFKEIDGRVKKMESQIANFEQDIETYTAEKTVLEDKIDEDRAQQTALEDELQKQKEKLMGKNEKVNAARNELQKRSKEIDNRTKAISALETEVQRNSAGRYALLRRCKLEQIAIPLRPESKKLDSLPVEENFAQIDPDAMDVDADEDEQERETEEVGNDYGIHVDFENLDDDLKQVRFFFFGAAW